MAGSPIPVQAVVLAKTSGKPEMVEELKCEPGAFGPQFVAHVIGSATYGAAVDQCSELCTSEAAMSFMSGAKKGSCVTAGYPTMVRAETIQPAGSPFPV